MGHVKEIMDPIKIELETRFPGHMIVSRMGLYDDTWTVRDKISGEWVAEVGRVRSSGEPFNVLRQTLAFPPPKGRER